MSFKIYVHIELFQQRRPEVSKLWKQETLLSLFIVIIIIATCQGAMYTSHFICLGTLFTTGVGVSSE